MAMKTLGKLIALTALSAAPAQDAPAGARKPQRMPTEREIAKMRAAAPAKPPVKPARPRKVLVWGHVYTHLPNPFANEAMKVLAKKTGAFEAVVSDDPAVLLPDKIKPFAAIVMNNIHERDPFLPVGLNRLPKAEQDAARRRDKAVKKSLLAHVRSGAGLVGIHAATAACQNWPEYGEMIGGYYGGHIYQDVVLRNECPDHPVNACFGGKEFRINDEVYIFRAPYERKKLRVLLSLDLARMKDPGKRPDKDYAVSWVRPYGKGRVFYTTLGHAPETYWNATFLRHVLAGVQFATGDLKADATPPK